MSRGRQSGLTLVEVMISLAVLSFVLLGFMSIMSSASTFSETTRENMLAAYDLQSAVEDSLGCAYSTFTATNSWPAGPTFNGRSSDGNYNNTPTSTAVPVHPLEKYWSTVAHPRVLREEQMWMEIIATNANSTSYRIYVKWKTNKGYYKQEWVYMLRASR